TPTWRYPARDVALPAFTYRETAYRPISLGGWRACDACSELIEASDWPALARHTLRSVAPDLSRARPGGPPRQQFGPDCSQPGCRPQTRTDALACQLCSLIHSTWSSRGA